MGVNYNVAKYMKRCADRGVDYSKLVTCGHQELYISDKKKKELEKEIELFRGSLQEKYSDGMFRKLGAKRIDVIDISDYEGANIIHDMNTPVSEKYYNQFTCFFDGGATEHIFNFPIAIANIMKMLTLGGYYIGVVPSDHVNGHGFYQFGPMLYIQLFCEQNGFELIEMGFNNDSRTDNIWVVKNPTSHSRIEISSRRTMMIYILAKKIRKHDGEIKLYEGYYQDMWDGKTYNNTPATSRYVKVPGIILKPAQALKGKVVELFPAVKEKYIFESYCEQVIL